jgi:hypothetical protein
MHLRWKLMIVKIVGGAYLITCVFLVPLYWAPWLASEPIENINRHALKNVPPPKWAKSFAVNHGEATYFERGTARQEPYKFALVTALLFGSIIAGAVINRKVKQTNASV